jgi:predicted  nucleic acid-binding Zn-ribbon protein
VFEVKKKEEVYDYKPSGYPGSETNKECRYDDVEFTDCDPIKLTKWREKHLLAGGPICEKTKNETRSCDVGDFPPGTQWLIKEHKKCVSELDHLKGLITDLHRWIDLIHERGQALYSAFSDLRKHLEDLQRQIKGLHKKMHDNDVLIMRLTKELDDWKSKASKLRSEVDGLQAKYLQLEKEHNLMKKDMAGCDKQRDTCDKEKARIESQISKFDVANRELKGQLLDAETYKLKVEKASERLRALQSQVSKATEDIKTNKDELAHCRIDILNAKNKHSPKYLRDTHVNLDMQMWITHNETKEQNYYPGTYKPEYKPPVYPTQRIYYEPYTTKTTYYPTTPYKTTPYRRHETYKQEYQTYSTKKPEYKPEYTRPQPTTYPTTTTTTPYRPSTYPTTYPASVSSHYTTEKVTAYPSSASYKSQPKKY